MFGNHLGNLEDMRPGVSAGRRNPSSAEFRQPEAFSGETCLCRLGRDRQVPANLMARELQKYSVRTAILAGFGALLLMIGLALAVVMVQGSKLEANVVLRLSLDFV